jgi:hypothetical protein
MGTAPQGQTRAQVRRGPPRNDIYIVANTGIANGSHAARMRAGTIQAKAKVSGEGASTDLYHHLPVAHVPPPTCAHNSLPHPAPWSSSTLAR